MTNMAFYKQLCFILYQLFSTAIIINNTVVFTRLENEFINLFHVYRENFIKLYNKPHSLHMW